MKKTVFFRFFPFRYLLPSILTASALLLAACAGTASDPSANNAAISSAETYRVRKGDTLYRIALRHGTDVSTLMRQNRLRDPDTLIVGQLLRIRPSSSRPGRTGIPATGDTDATAGVYGIRLQWPAKGPVTATYNGTTQKGIDIAGSRGSAVQAAAAGTVMYAGEELRGYGRLILIRHSAAVMTAYAHNDTLRVRKGQKVKAGETIATMGDSGTQGVKLHFEVRVNGNAVNPQTYLPR